MIKLVCLFDLAKTAAILVEAAAVIRIHPTLNMFCSCNIKSKTYAASSIPQQSLFCMVNCGPVYMLLVHGQ